MIGKIPVFGSIAAGLELAFGRFGAVLGTVWFPYVLATALPYAAIMFLLDVTPDELARLAATGALMPGSDVFVPGDTAILFAAQIVGALLLLVAQVGVLQLALGSRSGGLIYFAVGRPYWRYVFAFVRFVILSVVVVIACAIAVAFATAGSAALGSAFGNDGVAKAVGGAIAGIAVLLVIGVLLRLAFFIGPVAVGETGPVLRRSWQLGKGNVIRMVLIGLCLFVLLLAVFIAIFIAMGLAVGISFAAMQSGDFRALIVGLQPTAPLGIAYALVMLAITAVMNAISSGLAVHAYGAVTQSAPG